MKTLAAQKLVCFFTAASLAFLQIVPAGVAANAPADQVAATNVLIPAKPATDTATPAAAPAVVFSSTTDFQMNTGGIVEASGTSPDAVSASAEPTPSSIATPIVTATAPTDTGVVTLSGTRDAGTSILYSLDTNSDDMHFTQLVASGSATTWTGNITLPVGASKISVMARKTVSVSGIATVLYSAVASLDLTYTPPVVAAPVLITATGPTASGVATLSGSRAAGTSIWYSLDGGTVYKQLVTSGSTTSWKGNITLQVGSTTVLVQARKTAIVSGKSTVLLSAAASLDLTYTPPVVPVPAVTAATVPTAAGVVTLSGTRAASTSIWYSLDGGTTYKQLTASGSSVLWKGNVTLPVGTRTVLIQARKTATVSGKSAVLLSTAASLDLTYIPPVVPAPAVIAATVPTTTGVVSLSGTRAASTSIWYSLDGGNTYKQLVASGSSTSWKGNITLQAGSNEVLIIAKKSATVSGVANTILSSTPVSLMLTFNAAQIYLDNDHVIDRAEMLSLFKLIGADGVVSETEFNFLQSMQNSPSLYPELDYVHSLADAVVLGSPANATYQGAPLGDLAAGSPASQLVKLVNKWFLGMDHPATPNGYKTSAGRLVVDGLNYVDIAQGEIGDCYLMASLAEIALRDPDVIRDMFIDNGDGTFTVRFFDHGIADYVTVDRKLPTYSDGVSLTYANYGASVTNPNTELWTALAEKAYIEISHKWGGENSYASIEGGWMGPVLSAITGREDGAAFTSNTHIDFMASLWNAGSLLTLASFSPPPRTDVVGGHAYAVVDYSAATQMFTLFNPWGIASGLLTLTLNEIQENFSTWQWV